MYIQKFKLTLHDIKSFLSMIKIITFRANTCSSWHKIRTIDANITKVLTLANKYKGNT